MENEKKPLYAVQIDCIYYPNDRPKELFITKIVNKISDHIKLKNLIYKIYEHDKVFRVDIIYHPEIVIINFHMDMRLQYMVNKYKLVFKDEDKKDVITYIKTIFGSRVMTKWADGIV